MSALYSEQGSNGVILSTITKENIGLSLEQGSNEFLMTLDPSFTKIRMTER
jgi:hypothetical protein